MGYKTVGVSQLVEVQVDEAKFTPKFMEEFRQAFFPFQTIDDHILHLAQLHARGLADDFSTFIEGYGDPKEFGILFRSSGTETQFVEI